MSATIAATLCVLGAPAAMGQRPLADAVRTATLSNGLQVIVLRKPAIPFVTVQAVFRGGAMTHTSPEMEGVPHLLEHMLFRTGSEGSRFAAAASDIDASWNGETSSEAVRYYLTFPSKHLEKGLELLSDLVRKPAFSAAALEEERKVVRGEMERRASEPMALMAFEMDQLLWTSAAGLKNPGGNMLSLLQVKPPLLTDVHKRFYVPNNGVLIIAGDVQESTALQAATKIFGGWKPGPDPFAGAPPARFPALDRLRTRVTFGDVRSVTVRVSWQGPGAGTHRSDTYAADVHAAMVNLPLSPTQQRLVDDGLFESVSLSYQTLRFAGTIDLWARTTPERAVPAIEALGRELGRLVRDDYADPDLLRIAKKYWRVNEHYRVESATASAHSLAAFWVAADLDYFTTYADSLDAQTRPAVDRYLNTYLRGKPMAVVVMVPRDAWAALSAPVQRALGDWRVP